MNQQEREMIEGLFQRLRQAETQAGPRDSDAEALIRERMAAQPAAAYLLAQVVLVQEEGLRNLQSRVEGLEREIAARPQDGGGFLGGLFGAGQSSTPAKSASRPAPAAASAPNTSGWTNDRVALRPAAAGMQPGAAAGGGFMAGAMQTAMGVAGGMLLANAISGLFAGEAEAAAPEAGPAEPTAEPEATEPEPMEDDGDLFGGFFGGDEADF
jgi:hypothetical protein